jgi:hypothetical protein
LDYKLDSATDGTMLKLLNVLDEHTCEALAILVDRRLDMDQLHSVVLGSRCEICGGRGPEHPVECHERWRYNDLIRTQTLVRMIALCPACHQVKHVGLANVRGKGCAGSGAPGPGQRLAACAGRRLHRRGVPLCVSLL